MAECRPRRRYLCLLQEESAEGFFRAAGDRRADSFRKRFEAPLFLLHSRYEFWYTFRYVIMGAWLAPIFQVSIRPILEGAGLTSGVSSVLCMMLIAFCLSLCAHIGCDDRKEPFALHGTVIRHGLPSLRSCHGSQECPSHVFDVQEILRHPLGTGNDPYDICLLDALLFLKGGV